MTLKSVTLAEWSPGPKVCQKCDLKGGACVLKQQLGDNIWAGISAQAEILQISLHSSPDKKEHWKGIWFTDLLPLCSVPLLLPRQCYRKRKKMSGWDSSRGYKPLDWRLHFIAWILIFTNWATRGRSGTAPVGWWRKYYTMWKSSC